MSIDNLPLYELFNRLREGGFPLGIEEYKLALRALQAGFGMLDQQALYRLCSMLWVKSSEEKQIFDYHFKRLMTEKKLVAPSSEISSKESTLPRASILKNLSEPTEIAQTLEVSKVAEYIEISDLRNIKYNDNKRSYFLRQSEYFPITSRQMKQTWRFLRSMIREGSAIELDIEATVQQIAQEGMFLSPVLVPRRVNRAELLLLIDRNGSMVPFHGLSQKLFETAFQAGNLGRVSAYYFHNCPAEYLYSDIYQQVAESIPNILTKFHPTQTLVLILSDAGAVHGALNRSRIESTRVFLEKLRQHFRHIAWLNPVPRQRWFKTTAGQVALLVPMFECSRQEFFQAISVLRGRKASVKMPTT